MTTNSLNALIFGHEDAAFHLAAKSASITLPTTLYAPVPAGCVDVGWLDPEGAAVTPDDSVTEHTGHQGGGLVLQSMESSKTTLNLSLLETKQKIFQWVWSARDALLKEETVGAEEIEVASFTLPRRRQIEELVGIYEDWNTAGGGGKIRIVFPLLSLGAREAMSLSNNAITSHTLALAMLADAKVYTDIPGLTDGLILTP